MLTFTWCLLWLMSICSACIHGMQAPSIGKKRTLQEVLDADIPHKKRAFYGEAKSAFNKALKEHNVAQAYRILVAHDYYPTHLTFFNAIHEKNWLDIVYWLGIDININAVNEDGNTALHLAAAYGNVKLIQLLLDAGAHIHARNASQWTPLHHAVWHGRTNAIRLLLDHGASAFDFDGAHWTPLACIARLYHLSNPPIPAKWIKDLVHTFVTHTQFNRCKEASDKINSYKRLFTSLLALQRTIKLPRDLRYKIISFLPEDINDFTLFRVVLPQTDIQRLPDLIEHCPFEWFQRIIRERYPDERQQLITKLAPLIAAHRTRKLPTLTDSIQHQSFTLDPNAAGLKQLMLDCIEQAQHEQAIIKTVIATLSVPITKVNAQRE